MNNQDFSKLHRGACVLLLLGSHTFCMADEQGSAGAKTFIDYFEPTPIIGGLSKDVWGAATVGPRDPENGLEDPTMKQWDYWDGRIIKGPDGKYNMYGARFRSE